MSNDKLNDIEKIINEDIENKRDLKKSVWYIINGILSVMDYHETKNQEDFQKAKIYLENGISKLLENK